MLREVRRISCAPRWASSAAICLLTADWPTPASRATAEKLPRSTTRTKRRIASNRSIEGSQYFPSGMDCIPETRLPCQMEMDDSLVRPRRKCPAPRPEGSPMTTATNTTSIETRHVLSDDEREIEQAVLAEI